MYQKDFDTITFHGKHYFLVDDVITSLAGSIEDPELKMKILTRCIIKVHKNCNAGNRISSSLRI